MSFRTVTTLKCDHEHCKAYLGRSGVPATEEEARKRGWLCARGPAGMELHLCAVCVAKGLPDWWPEEVPCAEEA